MVLLTIGNVVLCIIVGCLGLLALGLTAVMWKFGLQFREDFKNELKR